MEILTELAELPFGSALKVFHVTICRAEGVFEIKSYPGTVISFPNIMVTFL